jgi:hypothetical protein
MATTEELLAALRRDCGYTDEEGESVDALIAYKDALEDLAYARSGETEGTSITFAGEASEAFADWIGSKAGKDYYVRVAPLDGFPFDAVLVGSGIDTPVDGDTWFDAVTYLPADPETGLAIEGAREQTVRVREVFVY